VIKEIFPGDFKSLERISKLVIREAEKVGFNPEEVYNIQISVDEAVSNIIDHAYGLDVLGYIEIWVERLHDGIRISILDDGEPFDPATIPDPVLDRPLEERRERGLGLYIMRKLMDEVEYDFSNPFQNKLTLIKYRS